ncbi:Chorismate pyruvate-lyase [Pseudoalteromonas holothuriae]|uniref:Chorismate pyruvate-lyase n=1 Tax=Pseudoalteromonas holothuriae TaxID=2963714 RepID=A0A9W4QZ27_9GAMM|nr:MULTISPECIES: chorismate lyase [unclassified Pseudoalteromonas]CAH9059334.1 Chorismate pyruvate-lyase [Pseudoalteromonas sp. CIP111854]CAH9067756.1 Chorismate pyruvate-lyase [Pseudoalteromonas sp. CIP111951]
MRTPFSIDFAWQLASESAHLPNDDVNIILDSGSLTALLKQHFEQFRVDVLREQWLACEVQHKKVLGQQCKQLQCREVLLVCDDVARVYAQSWISTQASDLGVRKLGNKPLGEVLFQDAAWQRSPIEIAQINYQQGYESLLKDLHLPYKNMFARRRVFSYQDAKIMVCEVFLPKVHYATQFAS